MKIRPVLLAMLTALLFTGNAFGALEFRFGTDDSGTLLSRNTGSYTINAIGDTVDVFLYLVDTTPGSGTVGQETVGGGALNSYGVQLDFDGRIADVFPDGLSFADTAGIEGNAAYTGFGARFSTAGSIVNDSALSLDNAGAGTVGGVNVTDPTDGSTVDAYYLAKFTFTGVSVGTNFPLSVDPGNIGDTVDANGNNLDLFINSTTASITVVPEPSSMILCGLVAAGGLAGGAIRRRFGRKQS